MRISTAEEMMNADKKMAELYGMPTLILMEHASIRLFEEMEKRDLLGGKIVIVCGKGNNGGDGYALARLLFMKGADVSIINAFSMAPTAHDALVNYKICRNLGIRFTDTKALPYADVIVDAIFGIGMNNRLNEFCSEIINKINTSSAYKISVDLPSGAYGDFLVQKNVCVKADLTVTFASLKPALVFYPSSYSCGEIVCVDIGIKDDCFGGRSYVIDRDYIAKTIPERCKDGHKGSFGRVLCVAGSKSFTGAAFMCGQAAMRTGCGTVKLCVPESIADIIEMKTTEVMVVSCPDNGFGQISETAAGEIIKNATEADAIVFGCGMGRYSGAYEILEKILLTVNVPVVIDADGIYALAQNIDILKSAVCPVILTPHVGEMSYLTGIDSSELVSGAIACASDFSKKYGVTLCLKNARTVVALPDGSTYVNVMGNSGMAKGGSGDVLAGMIGSFAAQGADFCSAAVLGVGLHAMAGDAAAEIYGEYSVTPLDVIENIGKSIKSTL